MKRINEIYYKMKKIFNFKKLNIFFRVKLKLFKIQQYFYFKFIFFLLNLKRFDLNIFFFWNIFLFKKIFIENKLMNKYFKLKYLYLNNIYDYKVEKVNKVKLTLMQLFNSKIFLGHMKKYCVNFTSIFWYGFKQDICFINLVYTLYTFRLLSIFLNDLSKQGGQLLLVNQKIEMSIIFMKLAISIGHFFVGNTWLAGSLTNFRVFYWFVLLNNLKLIGGELQGLIGLNSLPDFVFVTSWNESLILLKELKNLNIFSSAILDMNGLFFFNNILTIPGNDCSVVSIFFYNEYVGRILKMGLYFYMLDYLNFIINYFNDNLYLKKLLYLGFFFKKFKYNWLKKNIDVIEYVRKFLLDDKKFIIKSGLIKKK